MHYTHQFLAELWKGMLGTTRCSQLYPCLCPHFSSLPLLLPLNPVSRDIKGFTSKNLLYITLFDHVKCCLLAKSTLNYEFVMFLHCFKCRQVKFEVMRASVINFGQKGRCHIQFTVLYDYVWNNKEIIKRLVSATSNTTLKIRTEYVGLFSLSVFKVRQKKKR